MTYRDKKGAKYMVRGNGRGEWSGTRRPPDSICWFRVKGIESKHSEEEAEEALARYAAIHGLKEE